MRLTRRRILIAAVLVLITVAAAVVAVALTTESTAKRANSLVQVGMDYGEVRTALGCDGFRAGSQGEHTPVVWKYEDDSALILWFDADWRMTSVVLTEVNPIGLLIWKVRTKLGI